MDYLSFRLWIGIWTGIILLVLVALDASAFVCYITRFTEENFACLISLIFIYKAFENMWDIAKEYPVQTHYEPTNFSCIITDDASSMYMQSSVSKENCTVSVLIFHLAGDLRSSFILMCFKFQSLNGTYFSTGCTDEHYMPDVFLMSMLLFLLTFLLSFGLKEVKNSSFFPSKVRKNSLQRF